MQKIKTQTLIEIALCAAIALLIDIMIPSPSWSFTVSVKMVPIIILALRRGTGAGVAGGFLWGLLQYIVGNAYILTLFQFVLEYFVAFALIGLAGLLAPKMQAVLASEPANYLKQVKIAVAALVIGSFTRYVIHFIAGFLFWGSYAPKGQSPYLYSFLVNGGAFLSETLCCAIVLALLVKSYRRLIGTKTQGY
ncbi:energy-coupled thiamine transporter ThiT [Vaginisenegalia massiliensis]|uniref:energy-coupled thiamine transporter ThiT n=1 Tax=Vaginisenegalia massiliensis TaxID=2058294 RepID=UPI000F53AB8D|nr:energy-coupled thiamine transporter ThiT [Vaginisenegalia massiliensis]